MASVIGVFNSADQAQKAIRALRAKGFGDDEISIVSKDDGGARGGGSIMEGTVTGGAIGGGAGLLAGLGALAIPGIGPIVAAGPLAAALSGAVTGGLVGGLVDLGIPDDRGGYYEERVKQGGILGVVKTDDAKANDAANIFRSEGASDVEVH